MDRPRACVPLLLSLVVTTAPQIKCMVCKYKMHFKLTQMLILWLCEMVSQRMMRMLSQQLDTLKKGSAENDQKKKVSYKKMTVGKNQLHMKELI